MSCKLKTMKDDRKGRNIQKVYLSGLYLTTTKDTLLLFDTVYGARLF